MSEQRNRPPQEAEEDTRTGERSFFTLRNILIFAGILALVSAFIHIYAWVLLEFFSPETTLTETAQELPPEPRLQVLPARDYQLYLQRERDRLERYAYIDQGAGVVQIPIERAIELVAEQGLPFEAAPRNERQIDPDESGFGAHIIGIPDTPEPEDTPISLLSTFFAEGEPGEAPQTTPEASPMPGTDEQAQLVSQGEQLFQEQGCNACHQETDTPTAPTLVGIFGEQEQLESGETVTVDEAYLHQSILEPQAQIVQGYPPIMPSYEGRLTEQELQALVAYIVSLSEP